MIDAQDRQGLLAAFGFLANQAPSYTASISEVYPGVGQVIDLASRSTDPEADAIFASPQSNSMEVRPLGSGLVWVMANSSATNPSLDIRVDDGVLSSTTISQSVLLSSNTFVGLDFAKRDLQLSIGDTGILSVFGITSTGESKPIPASALDFTSTDENLAGVTDRGLVLPRANGATAIVVNAFGLTAATAINVGIEDDRRLDFFPDAYTLSVGETRKLLVRQQSTAPQTLDLSSASTGTKYFVSNPNLLSVDANGQITAKAAGKAFVSVVQGGISESIPILIGQPKSGEVEVDASGGLINSTDGTVQLGVPPGAYDKPITLSVRSLSQGDMPYNLPASWNFNGGIQIDYGDDLAQFPMSLSMPAPSGKLPGELVYLFQPVNVTMADGQVLTSWEIVDSMVVGNDGKMRTTSPPNLGIGARNRSSFGGVISPSVAGMMFAGSPSIMSFAVAAGDMQLRSQSTPPVVSIGYAVGGNGQDLYFSNAGILGDFFIPVTPDFRVRLGVHAAASTGLITLSETDLQIDPDQQITEFALPLRPRSTIGVAVPAIDSGEMRFGQVDNINGPYLRLTGTFLLKSDQTTPVNSLEGTRLTDLSVVIEVGGRDTVDESGNPVVIGGRDTVILAGDLRMDTSGTLFVPVPRGVMIGDSEITVLRKQKAPLDGVFRIIEVPSNSVKIFVQPRFGFVLNGAEGTVTVLDLNAREAYGSVEKRDPREVARIPLGLDTPNAGQLKPRKSKLTADGSRLYVSYSNASQISVIDAVGLQEVDIVPDRIENGEEVKETIGTQGIQLPVGARPFDLATDNDGRYLFVSDEGSPTLYVIDIDPFSPTYHEVIQSLTFKDGGQNLAPLGLRGVAVSTDRSQVYVAAPGVDLFRPRSGQPGRVLVADLLSLNERRRTLNDRDTDEPVVIAPLSFNPDDSAAIIEYGSAPYDLSVTDDPNVILVTDRYNDRSGVGVIRRYLTLDGKSQFEVNSIDLVPFGLDPIQGREVQAFGVSNAQGITFIPANAYKESIGEHPSYAVFSTFNASTSLDDSKKNPNLAPFFASYSGPSPDPDVTLNVNGSRIQFSVGAGSNIGFIRNPLGRFSDPVARPRLVAATNPILNGFADDVTVSPNGLALVPMQSLDTTFAYDAVQAIRAIEIAASANPRLITSSRTQYRDVPPSLQALVQGPLGQIPIDSMYPATIVAGHFGFYADGRNTGYGVPPTDPYGVSPNLFGPIAVGNLPRGIESQGLNDAPELRMVTTPYNQSLSLQAFPGESQTVETGRTSVAEIHSGALHESHATVRYQSQGASRGVVLSYDSLRAEPRYLTYMALAGLDKAAKPDSKLVARATATRDNKSYVSESDYEPTVAERASGFEGDEHFYSLPVLETNEVYGSSLWLDMRDADSGVYDLAYDFGLFRESTDGYTKGSFQTERELLAVVNTENSEFGAGWGIEGLLRIYSGDGALLIADGNGTEQIFLAPSTPGEAYTPLSLDRSVLRQTASGTFERKFIDGTVQEFDSDGLMTLVRDRNGNETKYSYDSEGRIQKIVDPVGLETHFFYVGKLITQIIDPAGRITELKYEGKNLTEIIDPDGSKRTFEYDVHVPVDLAIEPFEHLMTGQVLKRGNDPKETTIDDFAETIEYNDFGRVVGGTRVDGKTFTLSPAQMLSAPQPTKTFSPGTAPEVVSLLDIPKAPAERIEKARLACGLDVEDTSGATFVAMATYNDFDHELNQFQVSGFGQFVNLTDKRVGRAFGRNAESGQIGVQVDQIGNVKCFSYDSFGNVLTSTDFPDGPGTARKSTTVMEYGNSDFPAIWTKKVDAVGRTTTRTLDPFGNLLSETISTFQALPAGNPSSATNRYEYFTSGPADGLISKTIDPVGQEIRYIYDNYGRPTSTIFVDGSSRMIYDDLTGNPTKRIDADLNELEISYDLMNRIKTTSINVSIDAITYTTETRYDAQGNVIRETDRNGNVTTFQFDTMDRTTKRIEGVGKIDAVTEYAYEYGAMTALAAVRYDNEHKYRYQKNANGFVSLFVEDEFGQARYAVDEIGRLTKYQYNTADQLIGITMPDGGEISMTIDGRGRVLEQKGPTTEISRNSYDDENRVISHTVVNTETGDQVTKSRYNLYGTLARTEDALGHVTLIEHDAADNVVRVTENAEGSDKRVTVHTLDGRNRRIETTINGIASTKYEYLPSGRIKSMTDARENTTSYGYDELGRSITMTDAEGFVTHQIYDGNGNKIGVVDGRANGIRGNTTFRSSFEFDSLNRMISSTTPVGDVTRYEYDKLGNQIRVVDPRSTQNAPIATTTRFDGANRVIETTNAAGRKTTMTYDTNDNMVLIEAERLTATGVVVDTTRHFFDKSSRRRWTVDAASQRTEFEYDTMGNMTSITDARGAASRTTFKRDKLNRVVEETIAAGSSLAAKTTTQFHPLGMITEIIDPLDRHTVTTFDQLYFPETVTAAAGTDKAAKTIYDYDEMGNILSVTDPRGTFYTTTYVYDKLNRTKSVTAPSGTPDDPKPFTIVKTYDAIGNVTRETDPREGLFTEMVYDNAGRLKTSFDQLGQPTTYKYDAANHVIEVESPKLSDAGPATITMTYDKLGNKSSVVDAVGNTTCFLSDDLGQLIVTVDPRAELNSCSALTGKERFATRFFYDGAGRRVAAVDAAGYRVEWEYDAIGNVVRQVDPRTFDAATPGSFVTTFKYDALGQLSERSVPVGLHGNDTIAVEKYTYDKVGNLRRYEDPRGPEYYTEHEYDSLNHRTVSRVNAIGANGDSNLLVTRTEYDLVGNLIRSTDPRGEFHTQLYQYDAGNRLVKFTEPTGSASSPGPDAVTRYQYDVAGNLIAETDPRGEYYTTRIEVDALGRTKSRSVPTGSASKPASPAVTTYEYFPGGSIKQIHQPRENAGENILPTVYQYDAAGRMVSMVDSFGAKTDYALDRAGNPIVVTEAPSGTTAQRVTRMTYDDLGRLLTETDPEGFVTRKKYDAAGNVIRVEGPFRNDNGATVTERVFDARSRLRQEVDAEGNIRTYEYDIAGNQVKVGDPRGAWADTTMKYDGANRMIEVSSATGTEQSPGPRAVTRLVYDGVGNIVQKIDPRGETFSTTTIYNHQNKPLEVSMPARNEQVVARELDRYTYDLVGNMIGYEDPRGPAYATQYEVDAAGRNLSTTYAVHSTNGGPDSLTEYSEYDVDGNLLRHTGIGGNQYVTNYRYDAMGRMTSKVDEIGESIQTTYDRYGNVLETQDVWGTSRFTYDGLNRTTSKTNSEQETTQFTYSSGGLDTTTIDPLGRQTVTKRDRLGRVIETIDAKQIPSTIEYDEVGNPVRMVDRNRNVSVSTFDARNLQLSNSRGVGTDDVVTKLYEYDLLNRMTAEIDPRGAYYRTEHIHDARGRVIETRRRAGLPDAQGNASPGESDWIVEKYDFDSVGNLIGMTPARGEFYRTDLTIDGLGRVEQSRKQIGSPSSPIDAIETFEYNDAGQVTKSTDSLGHIVERTYDLTGRKTSETIKREPLDDLTSTWRYIDIETGYRIEQYDNAGSLQLATNYDRANRAVRIEPRVGQVQTRTYDDAGNLILSTDGAIQRTFAYDELNRLKNENDGHGNEYSYTYDNNGNILTKQDARKSRPIEYRYDSLNRQRVVRDSEGGFTRMEYDDAGNLTQIVDATDSKTNFVFDAMNRLVKDTNDYGTRTYAYDPAGNVVQYVDRLGRVTKRSYDGNQKLVLEQWFGTGATVIAELSYQYDTTGRMVEAKVGDTVNQFEYADNSSNQLLRSTTQIASGVPEFQMNYQRNVLGQATHFDLDFGTSTSVVTQDFTYSSSNDRLASISQAGSSAKQQTSRV